MAANTSGKDALKTSLNQSLEAIKDAGGSTWDVVKDYSQNVQEHRAANEGAAVTDSLRYAAEKTRNSDAFDAAKENYSKAFREGHDGVDQAIGVARKRWNERQGAQAHSSTGRATKVQNPNEKKANEASQEPKVVDGEVISTDEDTRH